MNLANVRGMLSKLTARRPEIFEVVGLALVAFGVGLIYVPAGFIAAGVALCFLGYAMGERE